MADLKINDLTQISIVNSMQLETDIGGMQSNKIDIASLLDYMAANLPLIDYAWSVVNSTTAAQKRNGYIVSGPSQVIFTLPVTANIGDTFKIINYNGGWQLNQNTGQTLYMGTQATTSGSSGYCATTQIHESVTIICVVQNTDFLIQSSMGNINLI